MRVRVSMRAIVTMKAAAVSIVLFLFVVQIFAAAAEVHAEHGPVTQTHIAQTHISQTHVAQAHVAQAHIEQPRLQPEQSLLSATSADARGLCGFCFCHFHGYAAALLAHPSVVILLGSVDFPNQGTSLLTHPIPPDIRPPIV
ncbi:Hypothetical protein HDN1F_23880 [gamma proteobacterium HdN1]|nr:Hypothetical protein HDN1F_23880 [gamma proteobacterium HdN1]